MTKVIAPSGFSVRGNELDDPIVTEQRRHIVLSKPFLKQIYEEWYGWLAAELPEGDGAVLEIGSGPGFFKKKFPTAVTSDLLQVSGLDVVLDAQELPFPDSAFGGVVMTNTLHHIPQPRLFMAEVSRCVRPGGVLAMVEPWVTPFSRLIYRYLHHEPFVPDAKAWEFPSTGPLSGANQALPWIMFARDRNLFEDRFPQWKIRKIRLDMPFSYLLSGGFSGPSLLPKSAYNLCRGFERVASPVMGRLALFAHIVLERRAM